MEVTWKQCLRNLEKICACGWSEFKGVMGREAGMTTFNVADYMMSMDVQNVPLVWNWAVLTRKLQIKIV